MHASAGRDCIVATPPVGRSRRGRGYTPRMPGLITALYRELDPLRPLNADEVDLYVDWQSRLDPDQADIKSRLTREFLRQATPERTIVRLLTGHRGSGKTTELLRVKQELADRAEGERVFTSMLFALEWLDLEDIRAEDVVLQMVRQLVADLEDAGISFGGHRFASFFRDLWEQVRKIRPDSVEVGTDPLKFSFKMPSFPSARREFREVLRTRLPTLNRLVTGELLPAARRQLAERGFADILLIVDDLDKINHRLLEDERTSNHEALFLHSSDAFRALSCSLLMTVPVEVVYSTARQPLADSYGAPPYSLPVIAIEDHERRQITDAEAALVELVGRRARSVRGDADADPIACAYALFDDPERLMEVVRASGGHVRSLLRLMTQVLGEVDDLPLTNRTVDAFLPRAARDLATGLTPTDRRVLAEVAAARDQIDHERFFPLLRDQYIFRYQHGNSDAWFDVNPLLRRGQL